MQQQQKMMRKRDGQGPDKQSDGSSSDSSSSSSDSGPGNGMLNPAAAMAAMAAMQHHGYPWHPAMASAAPPCSSAIAATAWATQASPSTTQTGPPPPGIPPPPPPPPPPPGTSATTQFSGNEESIEAYLIENQVDADAGDRLRALPPHLAATVMARGPVNDSRDPTAVLMARLRAVEINRPPGEGSTAGNALANP